MIYARALDQILAEDYFSAMKKVEQSLELSPSRDGESNPGFDSEQNRHNILDWMDLLAQPDLRQSERKK